MPSFVKSWTKKAKQNKETLILGFIESRMRVFHYFMTFN